MEVHEEEGGFYIKYLNDQKQQAFSYYFFEDIDNIAVDTENGNTVEIKINGNQTHAVQKGDKVSILMNKNNKQFYWNGTVPCEEAIKVMESIKYFCSSVILMSGVPLSGIKTGCRDGWNNSYRGSLFLCLG